MEWMVPQLRAAGVLLLLLFAVTACSSSGADAGGDNGTPADECFVHLYDGDDFDENDDNFRLTTPGRYGDLNDLPGADKNWDDEADSMRVGAAARVTVWPEPGFGGEPARYGPGNHADLEPEPRSLELDCS